MGCKIVGNALLQLDGARTEERLLRFGDLNYEYLIRKTRETHYACQVVRHNMVTTVYDQDGCVLRNAISSHVNLGSQFISEKLREQFKILKLQP